MFLCTESPGRKQYFGHPFRNPSLFKRFPDTGQTARLIFFSLMGELEMGTLENEAIWQEEVTVLVGLSAFLVKEGIMIEISKLVF